MPSSLTMTDKQKCSAGISILDADGQPFASVPDGVTVAFASSDPAVADFVVASDGLNGEITSGNVGSAIVTATVTLPDGQTINDTISVAVTNSLPGSVNFTPGTPVSE